MPELRSPPHLSAVQCGIKLLSFFYFCKNQETVPVFKNGKETEQIEKWSLCSVSRNKNLQNWMSNVFCFFLTTLWATWQFFASWCESSGNETRCLHFCFCGWLLKAPSQLGAVWFIMSASGPTPCFKVCPIWLRWCSEHLQLSIRRALICLFHCDLAEPGFKTLSTVFSLFQEKCPMLAASR